MIDCNKLQKVIFIGKKNYYFVSAAPMEPCVSPWEEKRKQNVCGLILQAYSLFQLLPTSGNKYLQLDTHIG